MALVKTALSVLLLVLQSGLLYAQSLSDYNVVWNSQSRNSSESMPCGGGDIGLNVWVENSEILFYLSRTGAFDENNQMLKLGRFRLTLAPNPLTASDFRQELRLQTGDVVISAGGTTVTFWVDVHRPVVHVDLESATPISVNAAYESWRFADRTLQGDELWATSYRKSQAFEVKTLQDQIAFKGNEVAFHHRNRPDVVNVFDRTVDFEGLATVKSQMFNPVRNRTFGGSMRAEGMIPGGTREGSYNGFAFKSWNLRDSRPGRTHHIEIATHIAQSSSLGAWQTGLQQVWTGAHAHLGDARGATLAWWKQFWDRSYVYLNAADRTVWDAGRNYQLFRYMLAANAYGEFPTKFNGGLFTFDPAYVNSQSRYSPDFRRWGGGVMTAQNQRLVYYPMFPSGDFDMLKPQFDFYLRSLKNAELRTKIYWNHGGASFTEQIEDFGLPNVFEWGLDRPPGYVRGIQHNAYLEYLWDTVLEFCAMMLDTQTYDGRDVRPYLPLVESCLQFFDEHYRMLAGQRGIQSLDEEGHYVLFPGSATETFKMTYNSSSTIAALSVVTQKLLNLPPGYLTPEQRTHWTTVLKRIPPIPLRSVEGHRMIAPAVVWQRVQNVESPQLYPVFPWGIYGIGRPDLDIARNTYRYDPYVVKFRSHVGWKQYNIFAARLGWADDAAAFTLRKLADGPHRFPAFWGPGFDWTPDHNWGGTGASGLQEMVLQSHGDKLYLLPAWPRSWNAHFKLHAPQQTTVEGVVENGQVSQLQVTPAGRRKDLVVMAAQ